jgi:hypothetical protein
MTLLLTVLLFITTGCVLFMLGFLLELWQDRKTRRTYRALVLTAVGESRQVFPRAVRPVTRPQSGKQRRSSDVQRVPAINLRIRH